MSVTTAPALARTDALPAPAADVATDRFVRRAGALMAVGAASWATSILTVSSTPDSVAGERFHDGTGLLFQVGVFAVVTAMARTGAIGPSRGARVFLRVERVLLALAMVWSALHFADPVWADGNGLVIALDAFWPLSMLGMLVLGIKVFRARRWSGSLRTAPLVAETWVVFAVPAFGISQALDLPLLAQLVAGLHLLVGYTRLGVLMRCHPELTRS
jgi:hypothetical protein